MSGTVPKTVRQDGIGIGRITSPVNTFTFASGSTTPTEGFADMRLFAGGVLSTPSGHTGSVYFQEADNYGGAGAGRMGKDDGTDIAMTDLVGGRPYTMPADVFPAWFVRPELGTAPSAQRVYKWRGKG